MEVVNYKDFFNEFMIMYAVRSSVSIVYLLFDRATSTPQVYLTEGL